MNILCNTSDEYAVHCRVMLTSLFENNKGNNCQVFILSTYLSDINIKKIKYLGLKYNREINIIIIDEEYTKKLPVYFSYHSIDCYLRIIATEFLPKDIDRFLYLDCDIIINDDLSDLWNVDLNGKDFAAVKDLPRFLDNYRKNLHLSESDIYINTGVMIVDCNKWRNKRIPDKAIDYITTTSDKLIACDQDALNATMQGKFQILSPEWNVYPDYFFKKPDLYIDGQKMLDIIRRNPKIIHFLYVKPWDYKCNHPLRSLYYKYYKVSEGKRFKTKDSLLLKYKFLYNQLKHTIYSLIHKERDFYAVYDYKFSNIINKFIL